MIKGLFYLILMSISSLNAQDTESLKVKDVIETFFEGFHKKDTVLMKSVMIPKISIHTAFTNKNGEGFFIKNKNIHKFLKTISKRSDNQKWDERLTNFDIKVDANLALAWIDYEFWLNDNFSHCGVNSFHLVRTDNKWKIISLIDSRKKENCN